MLSYTLDMRTDTPHFPGIGRYVRNLADHIPAHLTQNECLVLLAHENHPVHAAGFRRAHPQVRSIAAGSSPFSFAQQWSIPRLLRRQPAVRAGTAIYHSPYYLMPYALPCPAVLTVYDTIALTHPQTVSVFARSLFRITTSLALRASAHIIAISNASRTDLLAHFEVDPAKVTTIHLAASDRFRPSSVQEQHRLRAKFDLPDDYLLYVGSNKPHKNLVRLVDAYASLTRQRGDGTSGVPSLVIAGAWDERCPEARSQADAHDLGKSVRFLGAIDEADLPALYSAATAFIFPSRYEGFGLPVLEAMACGVPVACSHSSSLPEVAGEAALYFDPEDTDSIARAISALVSDGHLRQQLSDAGLRRARRFSWTRTAAETLDVYRSLARSKGRP